MTGFGDQFSSIRMREVIARIARTTVNEMRPENRIGKVYSYDAITKTARILFAGETTANLLQVHVSDHLAPGVTMIETFSSQGYNAAGDIVRIGGSGGQYYIVDYISGSPRPTFKSVTWSTDTPWLPLTLLNGWANWGGGWATAKYRRLGGVSYVQGFLNAAGKTGNTIAVIPAGFRPAEHQSWAVPGINQTSMYTAISIESAGNMVIQGGYSAAASSWVSISVPPFPADQ